MHRFATRVRKIEVATGGEHDPNWHVVDECGHALHVDQVEDNPDMRLVQPCDTDPMTYAHIQVTIAYADRNERLLNQWFARAFPPRVPPLPGESDEDYCARIMPAFRANEDAHVQRQREALDAARARINAAPQNVGKRRHAAQGPGEPPTLPHVREGPQ
jgi:hypothetical protein